MKKAVLLLFLLVCASAAQLGSDDYICVTYDKLTSCFQSGAGLPSEFLYRDLKLSGAIGESQMTLTYTIRVDVLSDTTVLVPLISGHKLAVKSAQVDGVSTGIANTGYSAVAVKGKGQHEIVLNVVAGRESSGLTDMYTINLPINITYTLLEITTLDKTSLQVTPAISTEVNGNQVTAQIPSTPTITLALTRAPVYERENIPPKVYADVNTLATADDARLNVQTTISYNVLHAPISEVRIILPEGATVTNVYGPVSDWKVQSTDGQQQVTATLSGPQMGQFILYINYEKSFTSTSFTTDIPELRTVGTERETGYLGIIAGTNIEVSETATTGLTRIDPTELPSDLWAAAEKPIVLAYKYLTHPWSLSVGATKHEELPVLVATVDTARLTALLAGDKMLARYQLQVKNNRKQYLEVQLPAGADLWSTFVDGQPVKPSKGADGKVLIPLIKSRGGTTLESFPVELVFISGSPTWVVGTRSIQLPSIDLPISNAAATVYLPNKEQPVFLNSNMEEDRAEAYYEPPVAFGGVGGVMSRSMATEEAQVFENVAAQAKVAGVLPVQVTIPTVGRAVYLSKQIVAPGAGMYSFFIQIHEKIWQLVVLALFIYLTWALQKGLIDFANNKKISKPLWIAFGSFVILYYITYATSGLMWTIIMAGVLIAVIQLLWQAFNKMSAAKPKKR